jgi:hypothetical protein
MKRPRAIGKLSVGAALSVLAWSSAASAQDAPAPVSPAPAVAPATAASPAPAVTSDPNVRPIVGERTTYAPPNNLLFLGGAVTFGFSYVPVVIVAAALNTHYDNFLYIPIVGPWLDIANRPQCGNGLLQPSCSSQWGRKAIFVADGILQAVGATAMVLGLVLPGRHSELITARSDRPKKLHVDVLPSSVGSDGYGVIAVGDF